MEQFLTRDIWKLVNKLTKNQKNKFAAVAYVSAQNIKLSKGDTLICNASDYAIKHGQTSAKVLQEYYKKEVKIYSNERLHCKLLLTDKYVIVGSANFSKNSAKYLIESAVVSTSPMLKSQTISFRNDLVGKSRLLSQAEMQRLIKIKVIRRQPIYTFIEYRPKQPQGNRYWIVGLKEYILNEREQLIVDKEREDIVRKNKIFQENISWIRVTGNTEFRKKAIEGDQVLQIFTYNKKISVIPFCTILRTHNRKNRKLLFVDETNINEMKWKTFKDKIVNLPLKGRLINVNSTREVTEYDAVLLSTLFKN